MAIGVYAVYGANKSLVAGVPPEAAVLVGLCNAVGGGLIRDVVCTETPLLLKREIYATAAAAGAALLVASEALGLSVQLATGLGLALALGVRALALGYGLSLPIYRPRDARPR